GFTAKPQDVVRLENNQLVYTKVRPNRDVLRSCKANNKQTPWSVEPCQFGCLSPNGITCFCTNDNFKIALKLLFEGLFNLPDLQKVVISVSGSTQEDWEDVMFREEKTA